MHFLPSLPRDFRHWQKPPKYLVASLIVSIGGLLNGYVSISAAKNRALGYSLSRKTPPFLLSHSEFNSIIPTLSAVLFNQYAQTCPNFIPPNSLDTGVIGPVTTMPTFTDYFGHLSSGEHGIVVSSLLLSATIASLFAGSLSDTLGHPRAIAIGSLVFAIGAALEAAAKNLVMFIIGRIVVGIGEGLFLSTLVV